MKHHSHSPIWNAHSYRLRFKMRTLMVLVLIATLCGILLADPMAKPKLTCKSVTTTTITKKPRPGPRPGPKPGPKPGPRPGPQPTKPPAPSVCRALWLFTTPCPEINRTLIQQVRVLSPDAGCADCHYLFVSGDNVTLTVDHSSADGLKAETITFKYKPTPNADGCQMLVRSQSTGPHTTSDNSVNYCNIYNLLTGSGLDLQPGFSDKTNKYVCPSFQLVPCTTL